LRVYLVSSAPIWPLTLSMPLTKTADADEGLFDTGCRN
jgi:hypothetical protein